VAGALSVVGYKYLTPVLKSKLGVEDTCGIHNLHGMPGILGAIIAIITTSMAKPENYQNNLGQVWAAMDNSTAGATPRSTGAQTTNQGLALVCTLGISIVGGLITGAVCRYMPVLEGFFDDKWEYEVPDAEPEPETANEPSEMVAKE
jgi:ammonium transporter Rh